MMLLELFDKKYDWEWTNRNSDGDHFAFFYAAKDGDPKGSHVHVSFERESGLHPVRAYSISFHRDHSHDTEGQGDQYAIFATVADIIQAFYKQFGQDVDIMFFIGGGASRVKAYNRMLPRLARSMGLEFSGDRGDGRFIMHKTTAPTEAIDRIRDEW